MGDKRRMGSIVRGRQHCWEEVTYSCKNTALPPKHQNGSSYTYTNRSFYLCMYVYGWKDGLMDGKKNGCIVNVIALIIYTS